MSAPQHTTRPVGMAGTNTLAAIKLLLSERNSHPQRANTHPDVSGERELAALLLPVPAGAKARDQAAELSPQMARQLLLLLEGKLGLADTPSKVYAQKLIPDGVCIKSDVAPQPEINPAELSFIPISENVAQENRWGLSDVATLVGRDRKGTGMIPQCYRGKVNVFLLGTVVEFEDGRQVVPKLTWFEWEGVPYVDAPYEEWQLGWHDQSTPFPEDAVVPHLQEL